MTVYFKENINGLIEILHGTAVESDTDYFSKYEVAVRMANGEIKTVPTANITSLHDSEPQRNRVVL